MACAQAKILTDRQIETLLAYVSATRNHHRNRVIVFLSINAGLRASKIANFPWDMVVGAMGGHVLELHNHAAKTKSGDGFHFFPICAPPSWSGGPKSAARSAL